MGISDWPEDDRPREKLLKYGAESLTNAELLAIFLRTGTAGKSAVDLARDLLHEFGGLLGLLSARRTAFCRANGLGTAKFVQLQAAMEMNRRYLRDEIAGKNVLTNPDETRRYLKSRLRAYPYEVFACLFLDNRHRIIEFKELFRGTIDGASVHRREVVVEALHWNAAAVIFAHNHPSGVAEPSQADISITKSLGDALRCVEIRVLDHIIIGDGEGTSLAERGLL
ncbi:MAG: DNA repair protein RadC [Thiohalocapsa sp.]|jgi:DNA repair protein RadC|nr:DNA repair protein RadC [Thiohalocapsa sp.]